MDIIKWRESYATGISSMDMQHQKLIELINKLYKVISKKESSGSVEEVLGEMTIYAKKHLQEEEALLDSNGYPEFAKHVAMHQSYLDKMITLKTESKKDNAAAVREVYTFLRQWWMEHIVTEDKKYGEFLKEKGVK